jgi:hypothetical protein
MSPLLAHLCRLARCTKSVGELGYAGDALAVEHQPVGRGRGTYGDAPAPT